MERNHTKLCYFLFTQLCGLLPQHGRVAVQVRLEATDEAVRGDEA